MGIQNHSPEWSTNGFLVKHHIVFSDLYVVPKPKVKLFFFVEIELFFSSVGLLAPLKDPDPEVVTRSQSDINSSTLPAQ